MKCFSYEGDLTAEGVKEGHGRCTTEFGGEYVGSWSNDVFHGNGTLRLQNGNVYKGDFRGGVMHGRGWMRSATGVTYEGELHEGALQGTGRMQTPEGTYEGEFQSGKYDGHGVMTYKDGTSYEGQWKGSLKSGLGSLIDTTKTRSTGTFSRGQKNGRFTVDKSNGSHHVEMWGNGERMSSQTVSATRHRRWLYIFLVVMMLFAAPLALLVRRRGAMATAGAPIKGAFVSLIVPVRTHTFPTDFVSGAAAYDCEMIIVLPGDFPANEVPDHLPRWARVVTVAPPSTLGYSQMGNYGASYAYSSLLLFLSPSHVPHGATLAEMMGALSSYLLDHNSVGIVGCTTLRKHDEDGEEVDVLEKGVEVAMSLDSTLELHKVMNGFSPHDHRVGTPTSVTAVSPYCMMVRRGVFREGFRSMGPTLLDHSTPLSAHVTEGMEDRLESMRIMRVERDGSVAEELGGWDMCLRAIQYGREVHVINVTVVVDPDGFPPKLFRYYVRERLPVFDAVYKLEGAFSTSWQTFLLSLSPTKNHVFRVIWDAHCCHCCGFSNEIVHFVNPLQRLYAVHTTLHPTCYCQGFPNSVMDSLTTMYLPQNEEWYSRDSDENFVWVSHTDPLSYRSRANRDDRKKPAYIIGRSMTEFSRIEEDWVEACNNDVDEVWVPSDFVRHVFVTSGTRAEKVYVIAEAIDVFAFDPAVATPFPLPLRGKHTNWRSHGYWSNRPYDPDQETYYKFLSNFKWEMRKGWEVLFESYFTEFAATDRVSLYVMTHIWFPGAEETNGVKNNCSYLREAVQTFAVSVGFQVEDLPHYAFITEDMAEVDVANVYAGASAFVLPTRGEGWGLPAMQAMSMGLPTISTDYGGQVDFMKPWNSFLIRLDGVEELPRANPYGWHEAKRWAMPSVVHLKELMRYVIINPEHARRVGKRARRHIVEVYSEEAIARQVDERLQHIQDIVVQRRGNSRG